MSTDEAISWGVFNKRWVSPSCDLWHLWVFLGTLRVVCPPCTSGTWIMASLELFSSRRPGMDPRRSKGAGTPSMWWRCRWESAEMKWVDIWTFSRSAFFDIGRREQLCLPRSSKRKIYIHLYNYKWANTGMKWMSFCTGGKNSIYFTDLSFPNHSFTYSTVT